MTIEDQKKIFNASRYKIDGEYVDFYNGGVFRGSSNLNYLDDSKPKENEKTDSTNN
jgi:hypothetical protein